MVTALLALVGGPAAAAAAAAPAPYPPGGTPTLGLSATVIRVGGSVTVSGSGFTVSALVSVSSVRTAQGFAAVETLGPLRPRATQALAAALTTDARGSFSTRLTFPQAGTFVITASAGGTSASARLEVVAAASGIGSRVAGAESDQDGGTPGGGSASGVGGGLPGTGAAIAVPLTAAVILLVLGLALVVLPRRRARAAAGKDRGI